MLFKYQYAQHSMEKMQSYVDFIFFSLWCNAPWRNYDFALYHGNKNLEEIVTRFEYTDQSKPGDTFLSLIREIYLAFQTLNISEVCKLQRWYLANNDIQNQCAGTAISKPVTYDDLDKFDPVLSKLMKSFFDLLWSNDFLSKAPVTDAIGNMVNHYKNFIALNKKGVCPYCGIYRLDSEGDYTIEAYDHYFPKGTYPFISINFRNLSPMCNKCNSGYKGQIDPIHDQHGQRRRAFYPYGGDKPEIDIDVRLLHGDLDRLTTTDIEILLNSHKHHEELTTWSDLLRIELRYTSACLDNCDYWFRQLTDECVNANAILGVSLTPKQLLEVRLKTLAPDSHKELGFIRIPFLTELDRLGVI